MSQFRSHWLPGIIGCLLLLADFFSKYWVHTSLRHQVPVFQGFLSGIDFYLSPVANHGAAWGILSEYQLPLLLFRCLAIVGLGLYIWKFNDQPNRTPPLMLVFVGAIGNVIDFFLYGYVVDMFLFTFWGYAFAVFNVADSAICVGVTWMLWLSFYPSSSTVREV